MLKPFVLFRSKKKKTLILQFINSNLITTLTHNPLITQFKFNKGTIYKRNNVQNINTNDQRNKWKIIAINRKIKSGKYKVFKIENVKCNDIQNVVTQF
jgi:hypothetical protein